MTIFVIIQFLLKFGIILLFPIAVIGLILRAIPTKRKCPHCGQRIYDTVQTCMHCKTIVDFSPKPNKLRKFIVGKDE